MENYIRISTFKGESKFSETKKDRNAGKRNSPEQVPQAPVREFDTIEFIREPRNDSSFLLALIR